MVSDKQEKEFDEHALEKGLELELKTPGVLSMPKDDTAKLNTPDPQAAHQTHAGRINVLIDELRLTIRILEEAKRRL